MAIRTLEEQKAYHSRLEEARAAEAVAEKKIAKVLKNYRAKIGKEKVTQIVLSEDELKAARDQFAKDIKQELKAAGFLKKNRLSTDSWCFSKAQGALPCKISFVIAHQRHWTEDAKFWDDPEINARVHVCGYLSHKEIKLLEILSDPTAKHFLKDLQKEIEARGGATQLLFDERPFMRTIAKTLIKNKENQ